MQTAHKSICAAFMIAKQWSCKRRSLGWESATERLLDAAEMQESDWPSNSLLSKTAGAPRAVLWTVWNFLLGMLLERA